MFGKQNPSTDKWINQIGMFIQWNIMNYTNTCYNMTEPCVNLDTRLHSICCHLYEISRIGKWVVAAKVVVAWRWVMGDKRW